MIKMADKEYFVQGNEACALGALAAGCTFFAGYPITPSTEIAEVMSKVCLGHLAAPCIIYNLNGYYDNLKELLAHMVKMGLAFEDRLTGIYFAENLKEIRQILDGKP